ncbi:MAG: hypothetical protein JNL98_38665 [Bryobacterales bacterium]|nr:hypothetical protein [Bryobacterales bacterium]
MQLNLNSPQNAPEIREQLRSLYVRRSAIDRLIQSLEAYQQTSQPVRMLPARVESTRGMTLLRAKIG